jgi:hypothetical protein
MQAYLATGPNLNNQADCRFSDTLTFLFFVGHRACTVLEVTQLTNVRAYHAGVDKDRKPEQRSFPMLLRDHPLMRYRGISTWPPNWTWTSGLENKRPRGEIGVLTKVALSRFKPANWCYLYIDHEGSEYIGCLLIDDAAFCRHLAELLQFCCNRPIAEIGGLDVSYTL